MGYGHFQPRNFKKRKQIVHFSVKTYHREYPMVIFNPEIKKKRKQIVCFSVKTYHMEYPMVIFNPEKKKRKQIVRFSVKTYHREYPMVIFNPEKKNGSRLSIFQSKHTIGSTLWSFSTQKLKKTEADCPFFSQTYHREYPMVIFNPEI